MLAIHNYGMYWERNRVKWSSQGVKGSLLGHSGGSPVDFKNQNGVYILYDENKCPVYIGQAGSGKVVSSLFERLKQHKNDHLWNRWLYFSWFGMHKVLKNGTLYMADNPEKKIRGTVKDALDEIEAVLIQIMEPRLNKKSSTWNGACEYYQYSEHDEVSMESISVKLESIEEILKNMKK